MRRKRELATIVAMTMLVASAAIAQQQQPPQRPQTQQRPQAQPPRPQPQQQQRPPQPTPPPPQQQAQPAGLPPLIFSPWTKLCVKEPKQVCFTGMDARVDTGMMIASAAVIEPEGEPKKLLRITVPLGTKIEHGTRVIIDQTQPRTAPYVACFVTGCMADYEISGDIINQLKRSQQLHLQAIGVNNQPLSVALPMAEFAKAHDGPPTDPKVIEERQKKLEEEFQRKREEFQRNNPAGQPGRPQQ